jgi:multidrug efflux pump subunit AcrA (membrane-fusion protein)
MKTSNTHRKLIVGVIAAAAFVAAVSCSKTGKQAAAQAETFGATPVKVFKVRRERITEKITYTGTLEAWTKINITPEVGGKIARIHVQEGDRVAKGQLLAELETQSIRLQPRRRPAQQGAHGPPDQGKRRFRDAAREDPARL